MARPVHLTDDELRDDDDVQIPLSSLNIDVPLEGGAGSLDELDDVNLTGLADGDQLRWDVATGRWIPVDHIDDATAAHQATAIAADDTASDLTYATAQEALGALETHAEGIDTDLANHTGAASNAHAATAISGFDAAVWAAAQPIDTVQTTSFTVALDQLGQWVPLNATAEQTVTLPDDATVDVPIGKSLLFEDTGSSRWTFVAGGSATILSDADVEGDFRTSGNGGVVVAFKRAANTWRVVGDLETLALTLADRGTPVVSVSALLPTRLNTAWNFNTAAFAYNHMWVVQNGNNWQLYVFCVDWERKERLFRRNIVVDAGTSFGTWQQVDLSSVFSATPVGKDSHHVCTVFADADNFIHLMTNMHVDPLAGRYAWSTAAHPGMSAANFAAGSMDGVRTDDMTYPTAVRRSDGKMLLFYRDLPGTGGGDLMVKLYTHDGGAPAAENWSTLHNPLIKGVADPEGNRRPYWWQPAVDPNDTDTIWLFFNWRIESSEFNERMACIKSTDNGATWTKPDGTALTLPIDTDDYTGAMVVDDVAAQSPATFPNGGGASVDSLGRPHVVYQKDFFTIRIMHHAYWTGSAWVVESLPSPTESALRPTIVSDSVGHTYVIYRRRGSGKNESLWVMDVTPESSSRFVSAPIVNFDMHNGEVPHCEVAVHDIGQVLFLVAPVGILADDDLTSLDADFHTNGHVLSVDVDRLHQVVQGLTNPPGMELVASTPIVVFGDEVTVTQSAVAEIGAPKVPVTGERVNYEWHMRWRGSAMVDASTVMTVKLAETEHDDTVTTSADHLVDETTWTPHETPWLPCRGLTGADSNAGSVSLHAGITTGTGKGYLRGVLELAVLSPVEHVS